MELAKIKVGQKLLRNPEQLTGLVASVVNDYPIDPVLLLENSDGEVLIGNGHHRVMAYWLAGRTELLYGEYKLVQADLPLPKFGNLQRLWERTCLS